MNNKEHFDWLNKHGLLTHITAEDRIMELVNRLIHSLYKPSLELSFTRDEAACEREGIMNEPINFGDLSCNEVKAFKDGNYFLVTIDEASPGSCPSLCNYIEKYMAAWGWIVKVETEW